MPPGRRAQKGGNHGSTEQYHHPQATGRGEVAPPPFPAPTDAAFEVYLIWRKEDISGYAATQVAPVTSAGTGQLKRIITYYCNQ
ncbi:hypothetical protein BRADI_2g37246v3 [Brachypodium distachyon]|uniref:Uncharacterized protein n=1 Tax=Brachypodium distachyon TaxID=15368 RepID=A0A0Q3G8H8_BRADI|nr:hypothetical protein BRADI_2g37246v3 [Brachypodium distachyon]